MLIKNLTKKTTISDNAKHCTSLTDQLLGLLNPKNPRFLIFQTRFGIHTFLLNKPIDIVILDKDNTVVKLQKNLKPNRVFFWNPIFFKVLELPQGTIKSSNTSLKDKISIL